MSKSQDKSEVGDPEKLIGELTRWDLDPDGHLNKSDETPVDEVSNSVVSCR